MISKDLINIGSQACARRKLAGLSQTDAGSQIQAHRNEISRIENGKFTGSIATFTRYLNLLGLSLRVEISRSPSLEDLDALFNEDTD
ncbi:MAG: helix-turn-helix transcriptional regulator [Pseudomonadota bacterium]